GSYVAKGAQALDLPPGEYRVVVERGPEYHRIDERVTLGAEPVEMELQLRRWIDMNELGFYSGDFHVHRPMYDAAALLEAEDLNFGVVFTMWNKRDAWE